MRHTKPRGAAWVNLQSLSKKDQKRRAKAARSRARQRDRKLCEER